MIPPQEDTKPQDGTKPQAESKPQGAYAVPKEYTVSNLDDITRVMETAYDEDGKPMSKEDIDRMRRRRRAERVISGIADGISAISNLIAVHNYAPNSYTAANSMSERTRKRWEEAQAQRQAQKDRHLAYALQMGKLKAEEQDRGMRAWLTGKQLEQQAAQADTQRQQMELQRQQFDRQADWRKEDQDRKNRDFAEGQRQFDANLQLQKQRVAAEMDRASREREKDTYQFQLSDSESVRLTGSQLNYSTVSYIFGCLPDDVKTTAGKPILHKDNYTGTKIVGYEQPTIEDMMRAIGQHAGDSDAYGDAVRNAIRAVAGMKPKPEPAAKPGNSAPGVTTGGGNTIPGARK